MIYLAMNPPRVVSLLQEWEKVASGAEADEVAAFAPIKWRAAVSCQQTPQPHPSPAAATNGAKHLVRSQSDRYSPVLGEGYKERLRFSLSQKQTQCHSDGRHCA